ncbi:MAG: YitT family protein [Bacillota bacterium]|nr:YitT family protein [Bacillota bacterium]
MKDKLGLAWGKMKAWKENTFTKKAVKDFSLDFVILLIACCVSAFSIVGVLIPNGLTSGGITGIARIIQKFVEVDFSILYYGLSIIVVVLVAVFLGWKEVKKILLLSIMYPAVLFIFEQLNIELLEDKDILLAAVFCGVFTGIYIGLVFWRGYASAGTDAIAKIVRKRMAPGMGLSKILLCIDAIIILGSALVYGRNIALYALITQVIITKTSEIIMYGFESKVVQLSIITMKYEEIRDYIIKDLNRGVSSVEIKGEYTDRCMRQLTLLCSPRESVQVKKQLASIDPHAFVTVTRVETVWGAGRGFSDIDKD